MPFLIDDEWARRLPKMWRWMRSFRIDGPGVSTKNTDETFTASIVKPANRTTTGVTVIAAKLTSAVSGRIGWYNAKSAQGKAKSDATGDLAETDITPSWATSEDLLIEYVPDIGAAVASIDDFTDLTKVIVQGLVVGADTATGKRIVLVAGGSPTGILFAVTLTQTGGSDGTTSTAATWTYTVTSLGGTSLGTSKSPEWPRPYGKMTAATKGLAYIDTDGAVVLSVAFEKPGSGSCA
jgi:hypothetical protein